MAKKIPSPRKWWAEWNALRDQFLEDGLTVSDAQGAADAELFIRWGVRESDVYTADPIGWIMEGQRWERLERERIEALRAAGEL